MKKLSVKLQNCYGIQKLEECFVFVFNKENGDEMKTNTFALYVANGVMKTSFAKIFKKLQLGTKKDIDDIKDHIFGREPVIKEIKIDEEDIKKEEIFVIPSFENFYESKNMASLLIDDSLKIKLKDVLEKRNNFFKLLEKNSGLKIEKTSLGKKITEIENQLLKDFGIKSFLQNFDKFNLSVEYNFSDIKYSEIFDDAIVKKIETNEFQDNIEDFLTKSDDIYSSYSFLEKGKFSLGKLKKVSKELKGNSFFVKENKIFLDGLMGEINSVKDLDDEIKKVEDELKETDEFQKIEKLLGDAKGFVLKSLIENNPEIVVELKKDKLSEFRKKLWISYFKKFEKEFGELKSSFDEFNSGKMQSDFDETPWKQAYKVFKERFTVPFEMEVENIKSAVLGESLPKIIFKFWDKEKEKWIKQDRNKIEGEILSQGEKRALYLLNIIFEIEAIKKTNQKTLFVIDDIADSFDYKNKYAIIEYLRDVSKENNFYQIILTHNFDFFRTIEGRFVGRENCKMVIKTEDEIFIKDAGYFKPFDYFKSKLHDNNKILIASIPFVRNLAEYCGYKKQKKEDTNQEYEKLTSLLHIKSDTNSITIKDLETIFREVLKDKDKLILKNPEKPVLDLIFEQADEILQNTDEVIELENKIVLSIAIRLKAEVFMIQEINNQDFVDQISKRQTVKLIEKYKEVFSAKKENIELLEKVNLMTPENIHLNSFMYEPILDMGDNELKKLYTDIKIFLQNKTQKC